MKESLFRLLAEYDAPRVLEIGVAQGENALAMIKRFPDMTYVGVDAWQRREDMEHEEAKLKNWSTQQQWDQICFAVHAKLEPHNAHIIRGDSHDILPKLTEEFHVIVVDGDHSEHGAYNDIFDSWFLLANDGAIWVDDVHYESVQNALERFVIEMPKARFVAPNILRK